MNEQSLIIQIVLINYFLFSKLALSCESSPTYYYINYIYNFERHIAHVLLSHYQQMTTIYTGNK